MPIFHEDGGNAMPRLPFHHRRLLRLLCYVFVSLILLYILVTYEPVSLLQFPHSQQKIDYDAHPTYEYTSLYRQKADLAFEQALEEKLLDLERDTIFRLDGNHDLDAHLAIWQLTTPEVAGAVRTWTQQWRDNNEGWIYNLLTAPPTELYDIFEDIPEIGAMNATAQDVQDDLTRYMLLWYNGGFYTDVETWDRVPLRNCQPMAQLAQRKQDQEISLMIGVETDEPYLSPTQLRKWRWERGFAFGQSSLWAMMRFDPILRKAIVRTISHSRTQRMSAKEGWIQSAKNHLLGGNSEEVSGRGMFTDLVLEVLSESLREDHDMRDRDAGLERRVTWKKFRALKETVWMDVKQVKEGSEENMRGLAVLPINVWYNGQTHSRSGSFEHPDACVNHIPKIRTNS
ncbi:hypothetical protein QTJ16_004819 [Diplocarpon rosae]|uniref:Uncharacterized protein n=1 Tax=Diplocarpon rosae TaxID=946125 RepID=A0AAD9SYT6_9HELO|nr:hypothetical protein QTJ16_004819 [Diplocarpon rosae]PBP24227.1 hypothetical protein BUE80_DR004871 [Diplocarpon rosae]